MKVTLLNHTPLWVCSDAIRQCWQSQGKSDTKQMQEDIGWVILEDMTVEQFKEEYGLDPMQLDGNACGPKDKELIHRIGNKFKHASTLEHLTYNFNIEGVSRALLQELARHRMANLSVKSTRYTLKELKNQSRLETGYEETPEGIFINFDKRQFEQYLVMTGNPYVDGASAQALVSLQTLLKMGVSNDKAKYALPEAYKTSLAWTINARSLQNFLSLRTDKAALWEIRDLAHAIFEALPEEHKYLFEEFVKEAS